MAELYAKLRPLQKLRRTGQGSSPHYGARSITAKWPGGSCVFADESTRPLVREDADALWQVMGVIGEAIIAARPKHATP
jgi:hypothetical protein